MAILSVNPVLAGEVGVLPRIVRIVTNDSFETITTENYLKAAEAQGYNFYPSDTILCSYGTNSSSSQLFSLNISGSDITMVPAENGVTLPVNDGDFAVFDGTTGKIKDANYGPSNPAKTKVIMGNSSVSLNHIATYTDTSGTIGSDATTAINGGNIQAGLSGTAGTLASFSSTPSSGSFVYRGTANGGDYTVTITNGAHGQSTLYSINDIGDADGWFLCCTHSVDPSPNLVTFNVTATFSDLALNGYKILYASGGIKQYRVMALYINYSATPFSGGGGDRLGAVSDDITNFASIPEATMKNIQNIPWSTSGGDLAMPSTTPANTLTVPGQPLKFKYTGGTTDYTAGSITITGILERVV